MAPLPEDFSFAHWSAVYNALSFGIAAMGSAMIFVWLQLPNVTKKYRTALIINGLVTGIATYHYFRIFNSWNAAFDVPSAVFFWWRSLMPRSFRIVSGCSCLPS